MRKGRVMGVKKKINRKRRGMTASGYASYAVLLLLITFFLLACELSPSQVTRVVDTPIFTPADGRLEITDSIAMRSNTAEATIYYTTDGSTPDSSSSIYTGSLTANSLGRGNKIVKGRRSTGGI